MEQGLQHVMAESSMDDEEERLLKELEDTKLL